MLSASLVDQLTRLVTCLIVLCGLVAASLAFYAGTYQSLNLRQPAFAFGEALLAYAVMLGATSLSRHPQMTRLGVTILLSGISVLSLAGVELFATRVSLGPPDPDTAAHMAIYVFPVLLIGGAIVTLVCALLVGSGIRCLTVRSTGNRELSRKQSYQASTGKGRE